jgi:hypothetical protein
MITQTILTQTKDACFGEWRLKEYLFGHVLGEAMYIFEDVLGPEVKDMVKKHFPQDPLEPPPHVVAFREKFRGKLNVKEKERSNVEAKKTTIEKEAEKMKAEENKPPSKKMKLDLKKFEKKLTKLDAEMAAVKAREKTRSDLMKEAEHLALPEDVDRVLLELTKLDSEDAKYISEEAPPLLWVFECRYLAEPESTCM